MKKNKTCNGLYAHYMSFYFVNNIHLENGGREMDKLKQVKILGKPSIYYDKEELTTTVRYKTVIHDSIQDDMFKQKLTNLGFRVEGFWSKYVQIVLPSGWHHLKLDKKHEIIVDPEGRKRIDIKDNQSKLLRRFDFIITIAGVSSLDDIKMAATFGQGQGMRQVMVVEFTDAGKIFSRRPVDSNTFARLLEEANGDQDLLMERIKEASDIIISEDYPDWKHELSYW
jgi:hypothetical protein